jgi:hypothetical protein
MPSERALMHARRWLEHVSPPPCGFPLPPELVASLATAFETFANNLDGSTKKDTNDHK